MGLAWNYVDTSQGLDTYSVSTYCSNCSTAPITVRIDKGKVVSDAIRFASCPNCGCCSLERKWRG